MIAIVLGPGLKGQFGLPKILGLCTTDHMAVQERTLYWANLTMDIIMYTFDLEYNIRRSKPDSGYLIGVVEKKHISSDNTP